MAGAGRPQRSLTLNCPVERHGCAVAPVAELRGPAPLKGAVAPLPELRPGALVRAFDSVPKR